MTNAPPTVNATAVTAGASADKLRIINSRQATAIGDQHRNWWHSVWQIPFLLLIAILVIEILFNACGVGLEEILQPDPVLGTVHIPGKHVVWRMEGFSDGYFNTAGMRDGEHAISKAANVYRIALLGDSATEGLQVPLEQTYGRELERIFAGHQGCAEVLNFGCSGYGTGQEVLQYETQVSKYKPDLTILLYNRGDATENIRKPWDIKTELRPYFYLDANNILRQDNAVLKTHQQMLHDSPLISYLRKNSCIYGVFSHANLNLSINEPLFRKLRGWFTAFDNARLKREGKRNCTYMPQDNWRVTSALLARLNNDCQRSHSKLLVVTFPNINADPEYSTQIQRIDQLSGLSGFSFLDLTPTFHFHSQPMSLFVKFHFSRKGHNIVAAKIYEKLENMI